MGIFKRTREKPPAATTQIRSVDRHPFGMLENYVPLGGGDTRLYRAMREAVPVLDAAVMKLIRLTGGFYVKCDNARTEYDLNEFLRTVDAGRSQRGINAFLDSYLDSMLTCGRAVGEIVTDGNKDIAAVLCGNVCDVQVKEGASPLDFVLCGRSESGCFEPLPYQELILFTPFNPEADSPYGVSMMRSMPFLTETLVKIYQSKEKVSLTNIHNSFVRSAATLALAMLLETETGQVQSFSAGSVRIIKRNPEQVRASAASLRRQAELMLLGYLKDNGFGFKAVRG